MKVNDLRSIGKNLLKEISFARHSPDIGRALGYGAAGDRTFPMDILAEEIIIKGLRSLKEPLTVISEEIGVVDINGGGRKVVIDPIDGSKNAISGIPFYCTSIALADGDALDDVVLSYVINLINGDEFWAEKDSGAFLNGKRVHTQDDDSFYLTAYEAQAPGKDIAAILGLLSKSKKTRCFGAIALDLAYLASGAISVFVSPSPSRSFDFAGGWLLVKEAGGIVTNTDGSDISNISLGLKRSVPLIASGNIKLHKKAITLLNR
ncbi:MAG: inositol monophosphatase family protein [Nitrospirota bacterium]